MTTVYTRHVGTKFNSDGSPRYFPGNTVISRIEPDTPLFMALTQAQNEFKKLACSKKYAFLPSSSFHMTVIEGLCDQVRQPEHWSKEIPLDAPISKTNEFMANRFSRLSFSDSIKMNIFNGGAPDVLMLRLASVNAESENSIRRYRDTFSDIMGIRSPGHDDYQFHISLGYNIIELDETERSLIQNTYSLILNTITNSIAPFFISAPQLTYFEGMCEFNNI
jgi:hypothetical protein